MESYLLNIINAISRSGNSIYDIDDNLLIDETALEKILTNKLLGQSFDGLALRTRSKVIKSLLCEALGYPVPKSFKKCQPRFLAQNFDVYIQKSNNLQIWNEIITMDRRYVIIKLDENDRVVKVKVITGEDLAKYDTTGTITIKHQAILRVGQQTAELLSRSDTNGLYPFTSREELTKLNASPTSFPVPQKLLPIKTIFERLQPLVGKKFIDSGIVQERNRGGELHKLICSSLGFSDFSDNGQFPDVLNQLLEVKLQTSPTIDLGLISPNSTDPLTISMGSYSVTPSDVRYAIFYATTNGAEVELKNLFIVNGKDFFKYFPRMEGKVINGKLQIPLPNSLFV